MSIHKQQLPSREKQSQFSFTCDMSKAFSCNIDQEMTGDISEPFKRFRVQNPSDFQCSLRSSSFRGLKISHRTNFFLLIVKAQVTTQKLPKQTMRNDTEVMDPWPTIKVILFAFITAERPKRSRFPSLVTAVIRRGKAVRFPFHVLHTRDIKTSTDSLFVVHLHSTYNGKGGTDMMKPVHSYTL